MGQSMYFSRKIILIAMLILVGLSGSCLADAPSSYIYIPEHKDTVIDDAAGRRYLTDVPNIDISQIWFIAGNRYFDDKNSVCLRARDLWLFSKPIRSSDGIWRGKKAYITQMPEQPCSKEVITSPGNLDIDTVTYTNPDSQHPEEAWDGNVPGIFQIYGGITDAELLKLKDAITQVHACLKDGKCPFPISTDGLNHTKHYELTPTLKVAQLLTMQTQPDYKTGKPCYSMVFAYDSALDVGAVGMDICYLGESVSSVRLDDDILE